MKLSKHLFVLLFIFFIASCNQVKEEKINTESKTQVAIKEKSDVFYHYSIWWAFVNKIFEGDITAKELKAKGDMGLGSYNNLNGELIMLNGKLYQATEDGKVQEPDDDIKIAYANVAFFDTDYKFEMDNVSNYEQLREAIKPKMPSKNVFYAFKIHGEFTKVKCGGLHKQEKPFNTGLDVLIPNRPIFERENFKGTMVGFYCPEFIGNINVAAFHLHFISDDKQFAGHVMEFEAKNLTIEMDKMNEYQFVLPQTEEYLNVGFDKEFQYKKK